MQFIYFKYFFCFCINWHFSVPQHSKVPITEKTGAISGAWPSVSHKIAMQLNRTEANHQP